MKKFFLVFILLNLIIAVFYIDLWGNGNTTSRILPVVTYFESGTLQIDKYQELTGDKSFVNGHYYSDKAPLPSIIVLPVFGLFKWAGLIQSENGSLYGAHIYGIGSILCSTIPFVLILFLTLKKIIKKSSFSPVLMVMLSFYGSFIFIFAGTFFNHLSSALFLLLAYIFLKEKKYLIAGFCGGLAFLCEYIIALAMIIWFCQILFKERNFKSVFKFSLGVLPSVIFIMIYNYVFTGSPFTLLYKFHDQLEPHTNYGFSHPTFESLWGFTFSDYRGLFFYIPFLLIVLFYFIKKARTLPFSEIKSMIFSSYLFPASFTMFLVVSSYFAWHGGWSYGPRLILFIAILFLYEGIIFLSKERFSKILFWVLVLFGMVTTLMAKATFLYSIPTETKHPFSEIIIPGFLSMNLNPNNLLTLFFGVHPAISIFVWCTVFIFSVLFLTNYFKKTQSERI